VQLRKLPAWTAARRAHAAALDSALADLPAVRLALPPAEAGHAYYKYYCFVRPARLRPGWTRDRVMQEVEALGVPCGVGACPAIWREPAFVRAGLAPTRSLPVAEELGATSLMLQVHPTLDAAAVGRTAAVLRQVLERASA
jgi:dTDP-4-amino-4,6-dideoxygalactose transaminase